MYIWKSVVPNLLWHCVQPVIRELRYEVLERRMPYSERFGCDISDPRIGLYVVQGVRPSIGLEAKHHPVMEEPCARCGACCLSRLSVALP